VKKDINSLYIHFPFCRHLCNYCDFYKKVPQGDEAYNSFESLLGDMWKRHDQLLDEFNYSLKTIDTLYIGGGTPSLWGKRGADYLTKKFVEKNISMKENGEFTLEVNPGSWSDESISSWKSFGINRFSLGIQALDANYLKMLDRIHNVEDVFETLSFFQKEKFNFSVDFMLGLPRHSKMKKRDIIKELDEIFLYGPSHVSLYILTTKKNYIHKDSLPNEEEVADEYELVADYFRTKGWHHYEVSNFSKFGSESQHNLSYWRCKSVAALGASAVGHLAEDAYRYKWKSQAPSFEPEKLTSEQVEIEKLYMGIRITDGLEVDERQRPGFTNLVKKWCESGFASFKDGKVTLNSKGFLLIDMLMDQVFSL